MPETLIRPSVGQIIRFTALLLPYGKYLELGDSFLGLA